MVENWCCIGRLMSQESIKYLFSKDNIRIISWHELVEGWYYFGRLMAEESKDNVRTITWHGHCWRKRLIISVNVTNCLNIYFYWLGHRKADMGESVITTCNRTCPSSFSAPPPHTHTPNPHLPPPQGKDKSGLWGKGGVHLGYLFCILTAEPNSMAFHCSGDGTTWWPVVPFLHGCRICVRPAAVAKTEGQKTGIIHCDHLTNVVTSAHGVKL